MKETRLFLTALLTTACLTFANRWLIGSDSPQGRPLAPSRGAASLEGCLLTGRIEGRAEGVFAVFEIDNPEAGAKEIAFHFTAARTPAMSPFSRMMPRPETVKADTVLLTAPNGRTSTEVFLEGPPPTGKEPGTSPASRPEAGRMSMATGTATVLEAALTPPVWTLAVSREKLARVPGWGAVAPVPASGAVPLDKGAVVLAVTLPPIANK